jgi:glutamine---fructose-6-phosphate transaminase (isomerizing)
MCGIVGYIGPREAAPILLEGLRRLEYRGYDSAGIALVTRTARCSSRSAPASWPTCARHSPTNGRPAAAVGLAHTRWATHGRPNDLNAHPHADCTGRSPSSTTASSRTSSRCGRLARARGHRLTLGDRHRGHRPPHRGGTTQATSPRRSGRRCARPMAPTPSPSCTLGEPDRLVGARMNVPLIVGLGEGRELPRLDVAAVLAHTRRVIFLEEGDVADLTPAGT